MLGRLFFGLCVLAYLPDCSKALSAVRTDHFKSACGAAELLEAELRYIQ